MDNFCETLVQRQPDGRDRARMIGIVVLLALLCIGTIILALRFSLFILFLTVVFVYAGYYFLTGQYTEYEYAVTNNELDIDKIIAKRRRSHLITVDIKKFTAFGPYTDKTEDKPAATLVLCSDNTGIGTYYADLTTDAYGETRILFTPDQTMVEMIAITLLPLVRRQYQKEQREVDA